MTGAVVDLEVHGRPWRHPEVQYSHPLDGAHPGGSYAAEIELG